MSTLFPRRSLLAALVLLVPTAARSAAPPDKTPKGPFAAPALVAVHVELSPAEFAGIQPKQARGGFWFGAPKAPPKDAAPKKDEPKREVHKSDFGVDLPFGVGRVTIGGETFDKVSLRFKGNGTILDTMAALKKSFKLDLGPAGGTFAGSKKVNLHCGVTDPSKLRDALGYAVYRAAGVASPKTTFAEVRLTVAGKYDKELLGVYTLVQEVDKTFLREAFGDGGGLLMKPKNLRDVHYLGDDWARYTPVLGPKREAKAAEAARLMAFAKLVDRGDDESFRKEIGDYLDVPAYLRFLAATAYLANTDSFFTIGHNYYLYLHPKTKKIHFIPWDLDRAFANFGDNRRMMDLSMTRPYGGRHKLTERVLAVPEHGAAYKKLLAELAAGPFAEAAMSKELAALEAVAGPARERDAKAAAARKERAANTSFGAPPDLAEFVKVRAKSVADQISGKSTGHIPRGWGRP